MYSYDGTVLYERLKMMMVGGWWLMILQNIKQCDILKGPILYLALKELAFFVAFGS